ncbi:nucleotide-binding universal stress UspA family protein [Saccharothrix tamanrassetensis]|uniref:Nucleotide-binding universal stress UspA family protein n=1 Tax=Saccharothrix tamanrassetensis TaxID=1051531 RepID=A0A841CR66_9PSEU|nr:universal stress protein [Saccharothrix tamanrassetensis]MBB5957986.1 nucleotide-binding universal stress UspA family protein [Saccharothrix tamanrassetensis]
MVGTTDAEPIGRAPLPVRAPLGTGVTRSVMVGVDGSDAAWLALAWAARHAAALGAELVVVGVGERVTRALVRRRAGTPLRFRRGDLGTLRSLDCATLVVGRHGEPFHPRTIGAAVASTSSTLVVTRGLPTAVRGEHGVVTAAVGGAGDSGVLLVAAETCRAFGSSVRLLHLHPDFGGAAESTTPDDRPLRRAVEFLRVVAHDLEPAVVLDRRRPHEVVAAPVGDLLVVGRGRDGGLSRIAKTALYHSSCPVLIPSQ